MGGSLMGNIQVKIASTFKHEAKNLGKRYKSLKEDITELIENLKDNPLLGKDLGGGVHKIRLAIKSKGHGKSGGARVISYHVRQHYIAINLRQIRTINHI